MRYVCLFLVMSVQFAAVLVQACPDGSRSRLCSERSIPQILCIKKGYQPSVCAVLDDDCNGAQTLCVEKGYQPSVCQSLPKSNGYCADSKNPMIICLEKGYQPSVCTVLDNGCNPVQAACLEQGYQPSVCAR